MVDLEKELYDVKGRLTQMKFNEESYKSNESSLAVKER